MINIDQILLARLQFAATISFHIVFPSFTIGIASWLAVLEALWITTNDSIYKEIYKTWVQIFAIAFGMGVVSGVVMSYQFGTNWSQFSDKVGNVIGPLLGYEVMTAFFLESSFLGIMLFGWNKVGRKLHFAATVIVAIGTAISAFWILSANSWMQTPRGYYTGQNGILYPKNWIEIIFNPSFPYRFCHMMLASYLSTAFVVSGVACTYLLCHVHEKHAKMMLKMSMLMAMVVTPLQILVGDQHGLNTLKYQPIKVAAIEGIWKTEKGAGLRLFAIPNQKERKNEYELTIPYLGSYILKHSKYGEIKGLNSFSHSNTPPVAIVFWSFRTMVGCGVIMLITGLVALVLYLKGKIFTSKPFQIWCIIIAPIGFLATIAGWIVTEVGRQPYVVYNIIKTSESVSKIHGTQVSISLFMFLITYSFIFSFGVYYIIKLIRIGIVSENAKGSYYQN